MICKRLSLMRFQKLLWRILIRHPQIGVSHPVQSLYFRRVVKTIIIENDAKDNALSVIANAQAGCLAAQKGPDASDKDEQWVADIMGEESSAVGVARTFARAKHVVLADEYAKARCARLKHHQQVSAKVLQLLLADTQAARLT